MRKAKLVDAQLNRLKLIGLKSMIAGIFEGKQRLKMNRSNDKLR